MTVDQNLLVMIKSTELGGGEPDLGAKLMQSFFKTTLESGPLPALIIFMNSGIFLTTEGSPVIDILRQFEEAGSKILSCGTCLCEQSAQQGRDHH